MHSMQHTACNQNLWAGNEVNVDYYNTPEEISRYTTNKVAA